MFEAADRLPRFDLVFSLGLIEHFSEPEHVIEAHLRYLKPGGTLMIGCPNFLGVNRAIVKRLAPSLLHSLDPGITSIKRWSTFDSTFGLSRAFLGYVGGFEPLVAGRCEGRRVGARALLVRAGPAGQDLAPPSEPSPSQPQRELVEWLSPRRLSGSGEGVHAMSSTRTRSFSSVTARWMLRQSSNSSS